jgi:hypothetical protein
MDSDCDYIIDSAPKRKAQGKLIPWAFFVCGYWPKILQMPVTSPPKEGTAIAIVFQNLWADSSLVILV